ncbi:MAG: hypothetical protein QOD92_1044 [Acidimicrobiaceae bacterium]|jgi:hypothetical protein
MTIITNTTSGLFPTGVSPFVKPRPKTMTSDELAALARLDLANRVTVGHLKALRVKARQRLEDRWDTDFTDDERSAFASRAQSDLDVIETLLKIAENTPPSAYPQFEGAPLSKARELPPMPHAQEPLDGPKPTLSASARQWIDRLPRDLAKVTDEQVHELVLLESRTRDQDDLRLIRDILRPIRAVEQHRLAVREARYEAAVPRPVTPISAETLQWMDRGPSQHWLLRAVGARIGDEVDGLRAEEAASRAKDLLRSETEAVHAVFDTKAAAANARIVELEASAPALGGEA